MALDGSWDLPAIERAYNDITILKNEQGVDELGFNTLEIAEDYCRRFCMIGHILQLNENKLTLHMLGQIMNMAVEQGVLHEDDFMNKSERQIMDVLDNMKAQSPLERLYRTFRSMTKIEHTDKPLPDHFCVSLNVKQRYINPLVKIQKPGNTGCSDTVRLSQVSPFARKVIEDFIQYKDTQYGCVKLV